MLQKTPASNDSKSCDPFIRTAYFYTEWYRSGRNELDSKSVWEQSHEGSNPSRCAMSEQASYRLLLFYDDRRHGVFFRAAFFLLHCIQSIQFLANKLSLRHTK